MNPALSGGNKEDPLEFLRKLEEAFQNYHVPPQNWYLLLMMNESMYAEDRRTSKLQIKQPRLLSALPFSKSKFNEGLTRTNYHFDREVIYPEHSTSSCRKPCATSAHSLVFPCTTPASLPS
uniref:Uncharacterized protein n=1 Tax=Cacopsylla melanoneura TaxID=428564 RepID=A0A8D8ZAL8_9HEMI